MPNLGYLLAAAALVFIITLALRAVPFAVLKPLRQSRFVQSMALWMPVGILIILAAATFRTSTQTSGHVVAGLVAVAVTVAVHLLGGRRTLLSVGAGTATYIALVNLV